MENSKIDGLIEYYKKLKEIKNYDRNANEVTSKPSNTSGNNEFGTKGRNGGNPTQTQNILKDINEFLPSFDKKIICIFGLNMSGKTTLAKFIMKNFNSVVFDVLKEYDYSQFDVYHPKNMHYPEISEEFDYFIEKIKDNAKWNMVVIDEANRVFPNRKTLFPKFRSFLDTYRHYNKSILFICRRPSQLYTDIPELAHFLIVFNLKGKNDIDYLNSLNRNVGEIVYSLPPYHFVIIDMWRNFHICKPIKNV